MAFTVLLSQPPLGTRHQRTMLAGIPDVVVTPEGLDRDGRRPVVLYLHGGAFIAGSYRTHAGLAGYLARDLNATVHVLEYRLAPEHPWPAGADDVLAAYRALLARVPANRIVVAGDSAGGAMTADLLLALKAGGQPQPAAAVMLSPAVGLSGEHRAGAGKRDTLVRPGWVAMAIEMLKRPDAPEHRILGRDLAGLAPIQLQYSAGELLAGQCEQFATELNAAGGAGHEVRLASGSFHVIALLPGNLRRARASIEQIVDFVTAKVQAASLQAE